MGRREARDIVDAAWAALPPAHRALLEAIGGEQTLITAQPLGDQVDQLRVSAGARSLTAGERYRLNSALGTWVPDLRLLLINEDHSGLVDLDASSWEASIARVAWHEWGHALSLDRATSDDIAAGRRLLELAPPGIAEFIREGDYGSRDVTHELVADVYATLMGRRQRGARGKPAWLDDEIWALMRRVTAWSP